MLLFNLKVPFLNYITKVVADFPCESVNGIVTNFVTTPILLSDVGTELSVLFVKFNIVVHN